MRILVVDNDPFILQVLGLSLAAMGHKDVKTALSAAKAAELIDASDKPFECILLDIQMPETDGVEFCEALRQMPDYRATPVIMLTAMSEKRYIDRAFRAGATDYITKPFESVDLMARLRLAEQLNSEASSRRVAENDLLRVADDLDCQPAVEFEDALTFEDMPKHLEFHALQNYLELAKRDEHSFAGLAVAKIASIQRIYKCLSPRDYLNFLADIADAISETLEETGCFFSYAGSGYFLIAADSESRTVTSKGFEASLQSKIDAMHLHGPDSEPMDATVVVSALTSRAMLQLDGVAKVVEAAINDVEVRIAAKTRVEVLPTQFRANSPLRLYGGLRTVVS